MKGLIFVLLVLGLFLISLPDVRAQPVPDGLTVILIPGPEESASSSTSFTEDSQEEDDVGVEDWVEGGERSIPSYFRHLCPK